MSSDFDLRPISPNFGARLTGLDVRDLDTSTGVVLKQLLDKHRVMVIGGQNLTPAQQVQFSRHFGEIYRMPYITPLADCADVIAVLKEADEVNVSTFGSWWHADFSYLAKPPVYSILHAKELPPSGGDTLFADMAGAFDSLSLALRTLLRGLNVMHSGQIYGTRLAIDGDKSRMRGVQVTTGHEEADVERAHPLVRLHPPTNRAALNANPTYCTRIEGMSVEESQPVLSVIYQQCSKPEHTLRQVWQPGDVLMWDNRAVAHLAVNDYDGHRRLLHRTTVGSEIPIAA